MIADELNWYYEKLQAWQREKNVVESMEEFEIIGELLRRRPAEVSVMLWGRNGLQSVLPVILADAIAAELDDIHVELTTTGKVYGMIFRLWCLKNPAVSSGYQLRVCGTHYSITPRGRARS